jgi:hypothetical protein
MEKRGEERGQRDKTSMISIAFLRADLARLRIKRRVELS